MQLFPGTSPLADDEGRADVISDKFLIAFQPGPGLTSVSRPFHSSDTVHREESKEHVEISLRSSSLIVCSFLRLVWFFQVRWVFFSFLSISCSGISFLALWLTFMINDTIGVWWFEEVVLETWKSCTCSIQLLLREQAIEKFFTYTYCSDYVKLFIFLYFSRWIIRLMFVGLIKDCFRK